MLISNWLYTAESYRCCETCGEANTDQESGLLTKARSAGRCSCVVCRVTGIPARHISNPLTNKWGWMFQLWKINQNFCWHFELIAVKTSWPHLCCREIRDLQCMQVSVSTTRLFSHVKWIQHQGRIIQFHPVVSSSCISRFWGDFKSCLFSLWDGVIFLCYCVWSSHLSSDTLEQGMSQLSGREDQSHTAGLCYILS